MIKFFLTSPVGAINSVEALPPGCYTDPDFYKFEKEAEHLKHGHEQFAQSVAFIQVAIALGAISALTKIKPVWLMSMAVGAAGLALCVAGLVTAGF